MRYNAFKSLAFLVLISLFSFQANAVGLQDYLQNNDGETTSTPVQLVLPAVPQPIGTDDQITHILELVVAGIVASALIISLLVLFLGRWLARRDKKLIQAFRIEAEQDKDHITSATTTIREQEKETTKIVHDMRNHATEFSSQKEELDTHSKEILKTTEKLKDHEKELSNISEAVGDRIDDIQAHWDDQLQNTVSTIHQLQEGLDKNLGVVDNNLGKMQQQKELSQELLQGFLDKHNEQSNILNNNSEISQKIRENLEETLKESNQLVETLKKYKKNAEKSLKNYTSEITGFEEQAYEQFDTSFQVADLARQELTANIEESRKHIESMRRQEEQSHKLNAQTMKNLEGLDYSKIIKISNTLDSTQDMFSEMHQKVEETRRMLDELREIETDIQKTAGNVESAVKDNSEELEKDLVKETDSEIISEKSDVLMPQLEKIDSTTVAISDYKMASGDNSTPLSFFRNIKDTAKQKEKIN